MKLDQEGTVATRSAAEQVQEPRADAGKEFQPDRRGLLQKVLSGVAALACATFVVERETHAAPPKEGQESHDSSPPEQALAPGNILERMREDLHRALKKPMSERKWVMVIDQQKCIGCSACTVACNAENNLPPGVVYRPVLREEVGKFPNVSRIFTPKPCMHCDNPPCVPVCPVNATWKQEDGIVVVDYNACIGCRTCLLACPYSSRTTDLGDFYGNGTPEVMAYETRPNYEYSKQWKREPNTDNSPIGNARKCHFCLHRLREGMLPACVTTCVGGATYFGDYNDKHSLVHKLLGSSRVRVLKPELDTRPSVFYLT